MTSKRMIYVYSVYDLEGNLIGRGSAQELAEKYYVAPATIWEAGTDPKKTLLHQYHLVREKEKKPMPIDNTVYDAIKRYVKKGYSNKDIAKHLGMTEGAVCDRIHKLRSAGELEFV